MAEKISLSIEKDEYAFLNVMLNSHQNFLHRLGLPDALKQSLIKDVHIIKTILKKSERNNKEVEK